jgi:hypothetical protein
MQEKQGEKARKMESEFEKGRSHHPMFVRKKKVRIKVLLQNGLCCFGDCHVLWPDGRVSDVINDQREFLLLTNATVQGEPNIYDVLTVNKNRIEVMFEIHRGEEKGK